MWKEELLGKECEYLTEKTSKLSDKGMAWFLLAVYNKPHRILFTPF